MMSDYSSITKKILSRWPNSMVIWQLFVISAISLFCEMLVIRWLATEIRLFAYFKNLPLLAAFLGLGLGLLLARNQKDLFKWSSVSLLYFSGLMITAIGLHLTHLTIIDPYKIMFFGSFQSGTLSVWRLILNIAILVGAFSLTASIFVGLGQKLGQLFEKLRPLQAYSINIVGALAGIVLFALLSNCETGPGIWLVVVGLLFLLIDRRATYVMLMALGITYMVFLAPYMARVLFGPDYIKTVWSPYYRIDVVRARLPARYNNIPIGYDIFINYDSFQSMLDCTSAGLSPVPVDVKKQLLEFFERPFRLVNKPLENVLILGAGSGSDVAAALRCGAKHVDAVEIDRSIYKLGKDLHREKPYDSPKVSIHIMDARTFLKQSSSKYDVIVFGLLDSHTAFSSLSSLRTDNYVFTVESYRDAKKLLTKDGLLATSFIVLPDWLWDRHCKDLYLAFGKPPIGYFWMKALPKGFLVAGADAVDLSSLKVDHPPRAVTPNSAIPETTDDWPFLFLPRREIPFLYVLPMLAVLLISIIPVVKLSTVGTVRTIDWQMFCLGMGFMLLEVRAMSAMSLLCGATWTVNNLVIGAVMVMILIGNYIASRLSTRRIPILIAGAIISIICSGLIDVAELNSFSPAVAQLIGALIYLAPLMFAGSIFSLLFKQTQVSSRALAFNIIGGLIGVSLEYLSMAFGIKALTWLVVVIYGVISGLEGWRCHRLGEKTANPA